MIQRLSSTLQIHIPYKTIFKSQKYLLRRLNQSISTGHNYIGQCKLSSRMTMIVLSYLFGLLEQPKKNKQKQVYYICQSKSRTKQVKQMAEKLRQYYKRHQPPHPLVQRNLHESEQQFKLEKSQTAILCKSFHKEASILKDYPKDKYISILSIKQYFTEIIHHKVHQKHMGPIIKADYMLVETVAYDQIVETCISGWINQIIIRRAYIQYRKLYAYYHTRDDKKALILKNQQTNNSSRDNMDIIKRRNSNSSLENSREHHSRQRSHTILHSSHSHHNKQQKMWSISEIDKRLLQVYITKKKQLFKQNGMESEQNFKQPSFEQNAILSLGMIGYLINYFQKFQILTRNSNKSGQETMTEDSTSFKFISQLKKQTLIQEESLKQLHGIIKKLVQTYPPVINPQNYSENDHLFRKGRSKQSYTLSFKHILELTKFIKDLIDFHQAFNEKYNQSIQINKTCYKEKDKLSFFQIKFRCLNQPLLTEIILQFNENFIVLMNNGISLEFYLNIFKPKILMKNQGETQLAIQQEINEEKYNEKSFKFCFDSPTNVADHIFTNVYGLNVTITPSEENLKTPEFTVKGDQQHDSLIVKAYGVLLYDLCQIVSDGVVVYFPSAAIIRKFKKQWIEKEDIYKKINQIKKIFQQSDLEEQNAFNISEYKKACDIGRGGVYLIASNGGMAKYTQFHGHYSRCIVFMGIPKIAELKSSKRQNSHLLVQNTNISGDKQKQEKKKKNINYFTHKQTQIEPFYYLKTTAKCLSNCINSHLEPKSVIFADVSYNKQSTKKWFPYIQEGNLNTSEAIQKVKRFHQHSQKLYEEGIQWQIGRNLGKRSWSKKDNSHSYHKMK